MCDSVWLRQIFANFEWIMIGLCHLQSAGYMSWKMLLVVFILKNLIFPKMIINAFRSCWWFCQILNQIKKLCLTLAFLAISVSGRDVCLTAARSWVISVQEAMIVPPHRIFVQQDLNETDYVDFDKRSRWLHKIIRVYICRQYHV